VCKDVDEGLERRRSRSACAMSETRQGVSADIFLAEKTESNLQGVRRESKTWFPNRRGEST
jgi:hypothetical protein